jgi:cob(I)alamin adenosyltransferase
LGALDELNAFLGDARTAAKKNRTEKLLPEIQKELFLLAGIIADPRKPPDSAGLSKTPESAPPPVPDEKRLTAWVRELEEDLPIRGFIIPGSNPASAKLDIARTVCRRAERRLITLNRLEGVSGSVCRYLNRLSDLLFMLARLEEQ